MCKYLIGFILLFISSFAFADVKPVIGIVESLPLPLNRIDAIVKLPVGRYFRIKDKNDKNVECAVFQSGQATGIAITNIRDYELPLTISYDGESQFSVVAFIDNVQLKKLLEADIIYVARVKISDRLIHLNDSNLERDIIESSKFFNVKLVESDRTEVTWKVKPSEEGVAWLYKYFERVGSGSRTRD